MMTPPVTIRLGWLTLFLLLTLPVQGEEARRCLKDGKVVITNVSCELLGNAQDLSAPTPPNYVKRGEPEARPHQATPSPQTPLPGQRSQSTPSLDSTLKQMLEDLFKTIFLPLMVMVALVVWFTRKTKQSLKRKLANVLISVARDHVARQSNTKPISSPLAASATSRTEPVLEAASDEPSVTKPTEWSLPLIRNLEWKRFEDVCHKYYELKGIRSETTPLGPDGGIDIRLYQDNSGKTTAIVQCKAWNERYVGVSLIRELLGVMTHEKIPKAFFMTTSTFSDEAKSFASSNRITLVDGALLLMMFQRLPEVDRESLLAFATEGDYQTPTCPSCGIKMVCRSGASGRPDFWGCSRYPACSGTLGKRRE